jgi:hypothetical protein
MQVEKVLELLENTNKQWLINQLSKPEYASKRVILSSDDLTGNETDEELDGIVSIRELVFG